MSGGGIIIQRNAVLVIAVCDPSFYATLCLEDKSCVDDIVAKAPADRTKADLYYLAHLIAHTVRS